MEQINTDKKEEQKSTGRKIKLSTKEGDIVEVDENIITKCVMVKGILDDSQDAEVDVIPLPGVKKETLTKVLEYLVYIQDNAPPEIEKVF